MQTGNYLGVFKGRRVWALPDGRVEVMFMDRPITFDRDQLRKDFLNWLERRGY